MEQRITIGQTKITFNTFTESLRELLTQLNETVIRDETLNMYVKFAIDELYSRLQLWRLPSYKILATGFHTLDTGTGLYVVEMDDSCDVYDLSTKIGSVSLRTIRDKTDSLSFGKFGMGIQRDIGFLQHAVSSGNDMYLKSIFWCDYNNQVVVYNGPESIKVGTQRDAEDGNPIVPVVDGTIGFVPTIEKFGFDSDIPGTRRTTPYYMSICRRPVLPIDLGIDLSVSDMPLDFPGDLTRLLLSTAQRICLEQVSGEVNPNLVQLIESQINNYIGGTNDPGNDSKPS